MDSITGRKILIITGDFVEDYEIYVSYQVLQMTGYDPHVICPKRKKGDKIKTAIHQWDDEDQTYNETQGHKFELNQDFDKVKPEDYAGLIIPGGRAPEYLRTHENVIALIRHFVEEKKPIACLCHGIQLLTAVGELKDRKVTCYPACSAEVMLAGGIYQSVKDDEIVIDGNLVTAVAYPGHPKWLKAFLELLGTTFTHTSTK